MTEAAGIARGGRKASTRGEVLASSEYRPFGKVLRDLLIDAEITTSMGNPNWSAFADKLDSVHYETLRKAVTGERNPSPVLMTEAAAALGRDPSVFIEYRLWEMQRKFDPREVGVDEALKNLERFGQLGD